MPVSNLLKQAIKELENLPLDEQDAVATRWLEEIKDERAWAAAFAATTSEQWDKLAEVAKRDIANGDTESLDDFLTNLKTE